MKRLILSVAVLGGCVVPASVIVPASAAAAPPAGVRLPMGSLTLDSYHAWNRHHTPPVSSSFKVAKGVYYVATVSGTFSYYSSARYTKPYAPWPIVCGTPSPAAQHQGSLGGDGPVGFDAQFIFSRPWKTKKCRARHLPVSWSNFQLNDGTGWAHPNILGPRLTAPTSDHTYSYAVAGHGKELKLRLNDVYTRDNYGLLDITFRPAAASDCASYAAFGFTSAAQCEETL
jgi:hypothetical protein